MLDFTQIFVNGIILGGIYAICAIGMILIFKATDVVSIVQGELSTLAAFCLFSFTVVLGWPLGPSIVLAICATVILGLIVERFVLRPLIGAPVWNSILATAALMITIQAGIRATWGPEQFSIPPYMSRIPFSLAGIILTWEETTIFVVCFLYVILLFLFFKYTKIGKAMRAVQLDKEAASLMGISVKKIFSYAWIMNSILMGTIGVLMAPILGVYSSMGAIMLKGFVVAVLGGFTSFGGAIIGGLFLGVVETMAGMYISTAMKDITAFALLIGVLIVRPTGLIPESITKRV
ncbi:MAG: branched-chain amino acid ABC transporter permease [Desulfatiglandales bacterium]|jgi:branched-chain amino acid transport system permease protein|nr:branched-chain amino acid ABC transporter permease [Desulfatiglandales bacterium]